MQNNKTVGNFFIYLYLEIFMKCTHVDELMAQLNLLILKVRTEHRRLMMNGGCARFFHHVELHPQ